ncbi:MAG: AAA family ATPase [Candidatus Heimdallarchaeum endolithica]|uniref:AAA family ATPase n=1 Tax=Candidatus Heimdallarchaeum endolithica TaxID=2876572 RepID=A0A9Y1FPG1_9ARCH|nr:MAG: AAA family ATPase [Candidatus Heimdallarchaeum endolithica]
MSEDLMLDKINSTENIPVPKGIINQVIGQDKAIEIIKIAAKERRNVLLLGNPGTGKSMLGKAYAELMDKEPRPDILIYPNHDDPNSPEVIEVEAGLGLPIVKEFKRIYAKESYKQKIKQRVPSILIALIYLIYTIFAGRFEITSFLFTVLVIISLEMIFSTQKKVDKRLIVPNLIIKEEENEEEEEIEEEEELEEEKDNHLTNGFSSRFIDATGVEVGRLLGDVKHDPYETGGLGTPPHERVMPGAIHLANKGVLFIDEIGGLSYEEQISLLTAMQERRFPITGRSTGSSSSLIQTQPIPCDFALVAAGNYETIEFLHPAFRSRFLGYGYEVKMNDSMPDTPENRQKIAQFIAQEVKKDKKLIHFKKEAVAEIIKIAQELSPKKDTLTLSLRKLGGYVRAASDIAKNSKKQFVEKSDVKKAFEILQPIEAQDIIKIEKQALEGYQKEGVIYIPSEKEASNAIGILKTVVLDNNQVNEIVILGREKDEYTLSQIKIAQTIIHKLYPEKGIFNKQIIVEFEGEAKRIKEGIGLAIYLSIISAIGLIKIKKNETAIGDLDILGNIITPSYPSVRTANAKRIGLKEIEKIEI